MTETICQHCGIMNRPLNADYHCPNCAKAIAAFYPEMAEAQAGKDAHNAAYWAAARVSDLAGMQTALLNEARAFRKLTALEKEVRLTA